jgi:hypothetical protein
VAISGGFTNDDDYNVVNVVNNAYAFRSRCTNVHWVATQLS